MQSTLHSAAMQGFGRDGQRFERLLRRFVHVTTSPQKELWGFSTTWTEKKRSLGNGACFESKILGFANPPGRGGHLFSLPMLPMKACRLCADTFIPEPLVHLKSFN